MNLLIRPPPLDGWMLARLNGDDFGGRLISFWDMLDHRQRPAFSPMRY